MKSVHSGSLLLVSLMLLGVEMGAREGYMNYTSTRGGVSGRSFEDALFSGYAADGGLFIPESIPRIPRETLMEWRAARLTYPQVVGKVVRLFVPSQELSDEDLDGCISRAYSKFDDPSNVIPFEPLRNICRKDERGLGGHGMAMDGNTLFVVELFHGRTSSFKDYALSLVGQLIQHFIVRGRREHVTILIGTSGDTGSAAIEAVRGLPGVDVIVLFPKGKVSPVQELQMVTVEDDNVHIFQVDGTSDDLDVPIKQCFPQAGLTSINSINWARIMVQVAHFVYISVVAGEGVNIVVPTGAAGNLVSGVLANLMGVPIRLHAATNRNDCVDVLLREGILQMGGEVLPTPANAMDISNPYNVERLLYFFSDAPTVTSIMTRAEAGQRVPVGEHIIARISSIVQSSMSIDAGLIYKTIKNCWEENHYMVCPHTATALALAYSKILGRSSADSSTADGSQSAPNAVAPLFILSTASPHKFPHTISEHVGISLDDWDGERLLRRLRLIPARNPKMMNKGEDWTKILQNEINNIKFAPV